MPKFVKYIFLHPEFLIVITTCIAFIFYLMGADSWKFSFIPDEWPFYLYAKEITKLHFLVNPFDFQNGVFEQNSVLSSMYQALFLQFENSGFAWRLSNIILIIPISYFFYRWIKEIFNKDIAIFSTIFLQFSYYYANFFKIGKNMPQALALFILCLYMASRCISDFSKKNLFVLGFILGISFYIYIGPLFPLVILPLFIPLFKTEKRKKIFVNFFILLVTYMLMIFPVFLNPKILNGPLGISIFYNMNVIDLGQHIMNNILGSFIFLYKDYQSYHLHYVTAPYLDIVTLAFSVIGSLIILWNIRKPKYFIILLVYIITCVVIGATSSYRNVTETRGIFFVPFGALSAGIGIYFLTYYLKLPVRKIFIAITFCLVFFLNFYQSQTGVFESVGHTGTTLLIKSIQEAYQRNENNVTLVVSQELNINTYFWLMPEIQQAYGIEDVDFIVLNPRQLQYSQLMNKNLYVLSYDKESITKLRNIGGSIRYNILSPQINYF